MTRSQASAERRPLAHAADRHDVVVVGAGVVGLACAYSLAAKGLQPLVIDAASPGAGSSWGNAGLIVFAPEIVAPLPGPGVVPTSIGWLLQRDSPLRLVPRAELEYLRWLGGFVRSCSRETAAAGLRATLEFNAQTADLFDALASDGLEFQLERRGVLIVYRTNRSFNAARRKVSGNGQVLSREETLAAEPLLERCAGAIAYDEERQVRPELLVRSLARRLGDMEVEIRSDCPCVEVVQERSRITALQTPAGSVRARTFVLAAGVGVRRLADLAGFRVPVEAGRGYSFDMPRDDLPLRRPVYLYERRLALTPFHDVTRVVGMMELGARAAGVRVGAIATMSRVGAASFRTWPATKPERVWAGLRPVTPDGLPVIGRLGTLENVYVAGGHGTLGVTLSLRTGQAIADSILGGRDDAVLRPFTPNRFATRRRRETT